MFFINHKTHDVRITKSIYPLSESKGRNNTKMLESLKKQVLATIHNIHQDLKQGLDVQQELDRYIVVYKLIVDKHPVLTSENLMSFVIRKEHVLNVSCLPDIGQDIREMFFPKQHKNLILYLIEYSLPYIKHNRLSLPNIENMSYESIISCSQIILGCLLGMFPHCKRRPTWVVRVEIFFFFHNMYTNSTMDVIYKFCNDNLALLRVSIIEYFVYFLQTNMPVENVQNEAFVKDCSIDIQALYDNILFITDAFRQSSLQKQFDMTVINESAIAAVEKLNRLCKGKTGRSQKKPKHAMKQFHDYFASCNEVQIQKIMNLPQFSHCFYIQHLQSDLRDLNSILYAKQLQQHVTVQTLPYNIVKEQYRAFQQKLSTQGILGLESMYIHGCLLCMCNSSKAFCSSSLTIRFNEKNHVTCDQCRSSKYMFKINLIGRLARVFDAMYYFCRFCCKVHNWRYDGSEFFACPYASNREFSAPKKCLFCDKPQCESMNVLDDRIGVIQNVKMCRWHMPHEHMKPFVYNLDTLWKCVEAKTSKKYWNSASYLK